MRVKNGLEEICVSVCMFAGSTTNTLLQYLSQENKNSQQAWPQLLITSPDLHVRQPMLLPSLAREHTTTSFFKALTADTTTADRILKSSSETWKIHLGICACVYFHCNTYEDKICSQGQTQSENPMRRGNCWYSILWHGFFLRI